MCRLLYFSAQGDAANLIRPHSGIGVIKASEGVLNLLRQIDLSLVSGSGLRHCQTNAN